MPRWILTLYSRAYRGRQWLKNNKNSSSYEDGENLYDSIVEQLNDAGYPDFPWIIAHDPNDRFGWHNKQYISGLNLKENNDYIALKWEELMIRLDEEKLSVDKSCN